MSTEVTRVDECPLCGETHKYLLEVEREIIAGLATQPQAFRNTSFMVTFDCPTADQKFEGKISLTETTMTPVLAVTVAGLQDEE